MAYTTYYLRFSNQKEAETKLEEVGYKKTETIGDNIYTFYTVTDQVGDIDIVGEIYNNDAKYDSNTFELITPPTKKEGWHVNVILEGELPEELKKFVVTPQNPYRVFA
jgi:hypothetical protein